MLVLNVFVSVSVCIRYFQWVLFFFSLLFSTTFYSNKTKFKRQDYIIGIGNITPIAFKSIYFIQSIGTVLTILIRAKIKISCRSKSASRAQKGNVLN